jgi:tetratricopeptide (TPR) repeat protein
VDNDYSIESAHLDLADYYKRKKMYRQAYREYKALYFTIPYEISFYEEAAAMLMKLDRKEEALPILKRSFRLRETAFNTKWIGQLLLSMERIEAAIPYLETAKTLNPGDLQLLYNLCRAYIVSDKGKEAVTLFNHMKKIFPKSSYIIRLKNLADTMRPKHTKVRQSIQLADSLLKLRKLPEALSYYQKVLAEVYSSYSMMRIGQIYMMQQNPIKATPFLEKAYHMNPGNYKMAYNLAVAYYIAGRYDESESVFMQIEQDHPGFADPSKLRQRLKSVLYH